MPRVENQQKAAGELEMLTIQLKEVVNQLRAGVSPTLAYALVYETRARMSQVVWPLGQGVPRADDRRKAIEILDSEAWANSERRDADPVF